MRNICSYSLDRHSRAPRAPAVCATCVFEAALQNDTRRFEELLRSGPLQTLFVPLLLTDLPETHINAGYRTRMNELWLQDLFPCGQQPSSIGSCDHLRASPDWQPPAEKTVHSAFVLWNIHLYLFMHSRFELLDILYKYSPTLSDFSVPVVRSSTLSRERQIKIPGPLSVHDITYHAEQLLVVPGVTGSTRPQFEYLLRNTPQLINPGTIRSRWSRTRSGTTLSLALSQCRSTEDPQPQILVSMGADVNFSPSEDSHTLNFINYSGWLEGVLQRVEWLVEQGLMDFEYSDGSTSGSSPVLKILRQLAKSAASLVDDHLARLRE